jgi:hypothetical protein
MYRDQQFLTFTLRYARFGPRPYRGSVAIGTYSGISVLDFPIFNSAFRPNASVPQGFNTNKLT